MQTYLSFYVLEHYIEGRIISMKKFYEAICPKRFIFQIKSIRNAIGESNQKAIAQVPAPAITIGSS